MEYTSLEQLVIDRYASAMAEFRAAECAAAEADSQRAFHRLAAQIYAALYADPGIMFSSFHKADIYRNRYNMSSENKPELYGLIKRIMAALDGFFEMLRALPGAAAAEGGILRIPKAVKLKKSHIKVLEAVGMSCTADKSEYVIDMGGHVRALPAWKWLAERADISLFLFERCEFVSAAEYAHDIFRRRLGDEAAFDRLIRYLRENGYECSVMRGDELTLDYAKDYGKKPSPLKAGWAERDHSGIECRYYPVIDKAFAVTLRIPRNTELLGMFDSMPDMVKEFVVNQNPKCSNCRYCVQTDKSGARPLACIQVEHGSNKYALCPRFPGFHFTWDEIDDEIVGNMIAYLRFIEDAFGAE